MAKIRDISNKKKSTKGKHKTAGKSARKGRTPIAKKGQGKRSKKKARKRLLEDEGGGKEENPRESSKDRATKKKSAKKSKGKKRVCKRDERGRVLPGSTANPAGRKKGALSLTAILREKLSTCPPGEARTRGEMLIDTLIGCAIERKDYKMLKEALDRVEGKVPDRLIAAVGSGELQGMAEDVLLAAVGAIEGEKEPAPDSQKDAEFVGPVQPSDLEGDQDGPVPTEAQ